MANCTKRLTLETFKLRLKTNNPKAFNSIEILGEYINNKTPILVKNKYGICKMRPDGLLNGRCPSIQSSIDKTEYFKNQANEKHNNKYDYSLTEYINDSSKVKIICKIHGEFEQVANAHLYSKGCNVCGQMKRIASLKLTQKEFIDSCNLAHNFKYDYRNTKYVRTADSIDINCPIHGQFTQIAITHKLGHGCPKCYNEKTSQRIIEKPIGWNYERWAKTSLASEKFDSFKFYIIQCYNENENFYKVGKTFQKISFRFSGKRNMPYNYKIIKIVKGNALQVSDLESKIKDENSFFKYRPKLTFDGAHECFSQIKNY